MNDFNLILLAIKKISANFNFDGFSFCFTDFSGFNFFLWMILALIFCLIELLVPGTFLFLVVGLACAITAIFSFWIDNFFLESLVFFSSFLFSFFLTKKYLDKHKFSTVVLQNDSTNIFSIVGSKGRVVMTIDCGGVGRVVVGREEWPAVSNQGSLIKKGAEVEVVKIEGNRLIVEQI